MANKKAGSVRRFDLSGCLVQLRFIVFEFDQNLASFKVMSVFSTAIDLTGRNL